MTGTLLIYTIKLACFLVFFYLGFKVWLSRETFWSFNRKVLLIGIGISIFLPFIQINLASGSPLQQSIQQVESSLLQANTTFQFLQ